MRVKSFQVAFVWSPLGRRCYAGSMRLLRTSTWFAWGLVCTALPLGIVASCTSFGGAPLDDAGVEATDALVADATPREASSGDAGVEDAKPDAARSCHEGDLLVNPGYEAAKCVSQLGGQNATQTVVPGHDSATACSVCGSSTALLLSLIHI